VAHASYHGFPAAAACRTALGAAHPLVSGRSNSIRSSEPWAVAMVNGQLPASPPRHATPQNAKNLQPPAAPSPRPKRIHGLATGAIRQINPTPGVRRPHQSATENRGATSPRRACASLAGQAAAAGTWAARAVGRLGSKAHLLSPG
jgi:hypothetical protein